MKLTIYRLIFLLLLASLFSCNSYRPVNYSKTHSHGFYYEDHIYFLLDYKVWKKGRTIWFIMPMELPIKVYFREIYLYRYQPDINKLEKLGVLRKEFMPRIDVKYTKFTNDNGNIVFAYFAGTDEAHKNVVDFFVWDSKAQMFLDMGIENPVTLENPLYQQYFSDYKSPWRDNPGIIEISRLTREILKHLDKKDYDLPEKW